MVLAYWALSTTVQKLPQVLTHQYALDTPAIQGRSDHSTSSHEQDKIIFGHYQQLYSLRSMTGHLRRFGRPKGMSHAVSEKVYSFRLRKQHLSVHLRGLQWLVDRKSRLVISVLNRHLCPPRQTDMDTLVAHVQCRQSYFSIS